MKKSLMKNYFYNLSYQILVVLTPFITIPYLARVLGPESIGLASFSSSIVSYFSLFASLGIGLYGQREIAYRQDDPLQHLCRPPHVPQSHLHAPRPQHRRYVF